MTQSLLLITPAGSSIKGKVSRIFSIPGVACCIMGITHPPPSSQPLPILQTCWLIRRSKFRIDLVSTLPSHLLYVVVCATVVGYLPYSLPSFSCNVSYISWLILTSLKATTGESTEPTQAASRRKRRTKAELIFTVTHYMRRFTALYTMQRLLSRETHHFFCKPWGNLAESHAFMLFLPFSM